MSRDASAGRRAVTAEEMDQPTLVWQKADGSTVDIPIPPDEPVTLGRDASNMVVLQSTFVSKRHATFNESASRNLSPNILSFATRICASGK